MPNEWDSAWAGDVEETHEGLATSTNQNLHNTEIQLLYNLCVDQHPLHTGAWGGDAAQAYPDGPLRAYHKYIHQVDITGFVGDVVVEATSHVLDTDELYINILLYNENDLVFANEITSDGVTKTYADFGAEDVPVHFSATLDISGESLTAGTSYIVMILVTLGAGSLAAKGWSYDIYEVGA